MNARVRVTVRARIPHPVVYKAEVICTARSCSVPSFTFPFTP